MRLSAEQLKAAPVIYQTLLYIKNHLVKGNVTPVIETATQMLKQNGFIPEYIAIADKQNLAEITHWDGSTPAVALIAAFLGNVRLIDNLDLT